MGPKTKWLAGYALLVAVLLVGFGLYKLVSLNWFAGVTAPTLLVYSVIFFGAIALLWHVVSNFIKAAKESKK